MLYLCNLYAYNQVKIGFKKGVLSKKMLYHKQTVFEKEGFSGGVPEANK